MKRRCMDVPNLADISFSQLLTIAYVLSGKTYEVIAEEMGLGLTTIHRYFTDPSYNPPSYRVPKLCRVLGNYPIIEWQAIHVGGLFIKTEVSKEAQNLDMQISLLTKEFSDVLREEAQARLDDTYSDEELSRIDKELSDLLRKGNQVSLLIAARRSKHR